MISINIKGIKIRIRLFNIGLVMLGVFFILKYVLSFALPKSLYIPLLLLITFSGKREDIIGIAVCCIPLRMMIQTVPWLLICIIVYLIKFPQRKLLNLNFAVGSISILIVYELVHNFGYELSITTLASFVVPYVFCVFVMSIDKSKLDYAVIVRLLSVATVFVGGVFIGRLFILSNYNLAAVFTNISRLGVSTTETDVNVIVENPNTLGFMCLFASIGLLQLWLAKKHKKTDIAIIMLLMFVSTLTFSRTFIVCLLILLVLMILAKKGSISSKTKTLAEIIFSVIFLVLIINYVAPNVIEKMLERFNVANILNGRDHIFRYYNDFIFSEMKIIMWGIGLQNYPSRINGIFNSVPHNGIQEVLLVWGIPGIVLIGIFIIGLFVSAKQINKKIRLINLIPLIMILAKIQVGQFVSASFNIIMIVVAYLSMCEDFTKIEKNNDCSLK